MKQELKTEKTASKKGKREFIEAFTGISFRGFEMWCRNRDINPYVPDSLKMWLKERKNIIIE